MKIITKVVNDQIKRWELVTQSEENFRGLFESAHDAIIILKPENEIVLNVNQRACDIYGFSRDEFIGMSLEKISKNIQRGKRNIKSTIKKGFYHQFETTQFRKDGSEITLQINASLMEYDKSPAILSINRDITENKKAEKELCEAHELLKVNNIALKEKNVTLKNVLDHIDKEKKTIELNIQKNICKVILPTLKSLEQKLGPHEKKYLSILETNLNDITSQFLNHIELNYQKLSSREIQICNMIRQGHTSKEISNLLEISIETIRSQRKNIRKKLNISNQDINLVTYLRSIEEHTTPTSV